MNRWIVPGALCALLCLALPAHAQEGEKGERPPMPEWLKLTPQHKALQKSVGTWKVVSKWEGMAQPGTGVARAQLTLNGRYLKQKYEGTMGGHPYSGVLLIGYDTIDKQYVSIWMDSMSPMPTITRGNEKDGVMHFEGTDVDWSDMSGKKVKIALRIKWTSDDQYTLSMFHPGKEKAIGSMTYTRVKSPKKDQSRFKKFAGTWDCQATMMGGKPSAAVATWKIADTGMAVQHYRGEYAGQPHIGKNMLCYDPIDKVLISIWIDNYSSFISVMKGKPTEDQGMRLAGMVPSHTKPGTKEKFGIEINWVNDDEYVMTMLSFRGTESFATGKIVYKRRK